MLAMVRTCLECTKTLCVWRSAREGVDLVKEYQRRMGHISVEQLTQISRDWNLHLPFSTGDIYKSNHISGPDPAHIKGKNKRTRRGPNTGRGR
jgi:hypothetical protein